MKHLKEIINKYLYFKKIFFSSINIKYYLDEQEDLIDEIGKNTFKNRTYFFI